MNELAQIVIQSVTMNEVFIKYGLQPNGHGFVLCPFHSEKTPSMSAYKNGTRWHCFGCGEGGNAIDFVEKIFNVTFIQAVARINDDFGLNLPINKKTSYRERERAREQRRARQAKTDNENRMKYIDRYNQRLLCTYRRWLAKQGENERVKFQLDYIDRMLDSCLYGEKTIERDIKPTIRALFYKLRG